VTFPAPDRILVATAAAGFALAAWRWEAADLRVEAPALPRMEAGRSTADSTLGVGVSSAEVIGRDPFRLSNRPSRVRLGDAPEPERPIVPRYRPPLVLRGIMGGPPWTALVSGIPGERGTALLAIGDRRDSLWVRSIDATSVVLVGPDTSWVLTLSGGRP
jgi:hypothetical protein